MDELTAADRTRSLSETSGPAATRWLEPGVVVHRYVILEVVGSGGMGVVYKAYDPELARPIALKLLHARRTSSGSGPASSARERLLREAQALARLSHPNVVTVYDVGTFGDDVFVATEFLEGETLRRWLALAPRSRSDVLRVIVAAGEGLAAAHRAGLVHRDVKPENIVVGADGRVRVLDFGLARTTSDTALLSSSSTRAPEPPSPGPQPAAASARSLPDSSSLHRSYTERGELLAAQLTEQGAILGTPRYMSPEQYLGKNLDPRTDQFSLAVTSYEALTGTFPFDAASRAGLRDAIVGGNVRTSEAAERLPRWLRSTLLRALSPRPEDRYPSLDAFLDAIRRGQRRSRSGWLAASAVVLASAVAIVGLRATRTPPPCAGAARWLDGVWDEGRKAAVAQAFERTGAAHAAKAVQVVGERLDAFAKTWAAAHTEACEATRVRGEQSEELLDLRMACLRHKLDDARATVDVFASADRGVVDRAAGAVQSLASLEDCADAAALRTRQTLPMDPAARARVDALAAELSKVRAARIAGRFREGVAAAQELVKKIEPLGYRPLEAEALCVAGDLADDAAAYPEAERLLRRAARTADVARNDALAAEALLSLGWVVGERLARYAEAKEIALDSVARIERAGSRMLQRATAERLLGALAYRESQMADARAHAEAALRLRRQGHGGEPDVHLAWIISDLADIERQEGHHERALALYDEAVSTQEAIVGATHPTLAFMLSSRSIALSKLGRLDEASTSVERAIALWEEELGPRHATVAAALNNLGEVRRRQGRADEAAALQERALSILEETLAADHPSIASVKNNLGWAQLEAGRYPRARVTFEAALAIANHRPDDDLSDLPDILDGLGGALLGVGQAAAALPLFERAASIRSRRAVVGQEANAQGDFLHAKALRASGAPRARWEELARRARDAYALLPHHERELQEILRWLSDGRGPGGYP